MRIALTAILVSACSVNLPPEALPSDPPPAQEAAADPLRDLKQGPEQLAALCARDFNDPVSRAFCVSPAPTVTSITGLEKLLGLDFKPGNLENGVGGNPAFALTGNSSALAARSVSAINPRALIFTPPNRRARVGPDGTRLPQDASCDQIEPTAPLPELVAMGFVRGESFVELISKGLDGELRFFLLRFERAGNDNAALFLPESESGFTGGYSLYSDDDLADTILDCKQCHQPDGPGTRKLLRMQELQNPWAHFFRNNRPVGTPLLADFLAAHCGEDSYAGIPMALIADPTSTETAGLASMLTQSRGPDPAALQGLVENEGFCRMQANEYVTFTIEAEVEASMPLEPAVNVPPGFSATWMTLFQASVAGRFIPTPYHDVKVTDPGKLAAATRAYALVRDGELPREAMPDIRDVFLDSALPELSFRPAAGLDGRGILEHMCGQCHNGRLDQSLSRARFRVDALDAMPRAEKNLAISRLQTPATSALRMPPPRFRELSDAELALVIAELEK